jgi:epoxyqueuosine reductase
MSYKSRIRRFFQNRLLKPLIKRLDEWDADVVQRPGSLHGNENSPVRFNIPKESLKLAGDHAPLPGFPRSFPEVLGSVTNIRKSVRDLERNPVDGKKQIELQTLEALRVYARSVGVNEIGFCSVPQEWVFKGTAIRYNQAIVLVMEMDKEHMSKAPNPDTAVMVHETYNALGQASNKVADWLRERGYAAHAGHPLGGMALYPPMAQAAGLGWRGLNGLIITPQFGPRVRLAAVFTEIENLPLYQGDEHAWILNLCKYCRRCIRDCPPDAFYETPVRHINSLVTALDVSKCFPYFAAHHGCSICIKVCPFNNYDYDFIKRKFKGQKKARERVN